MFFLMVSAIDEKNIKTSTKNSVMTMLLMNFNHPIHFAHSTDRSIANIRASMSIKLLFFGRLLLNTLKLEI
jgi:hypothetical protein